MIVSIRNSIISYFILFFSLCSIGALPAEDIEQSDDNQAELRKLSEAFGHFIGRNLNSPGIDFDLELVIKGMRDGAAGKSEPMPEEEYEKLLKIYQTKGYEKISDQNLKASNDFLVENAKNSDIIEIEPGKLQYKILKEGQGQAVAEGDTPVIEYIGTFLDGGLIDSSEKSGPVPISLEQTIPGFKRGIVGMREGEKRKLFIHPDLGFGTSSLLPPNALLIFEVEVIAVNPSIEENENNALDNLEEGIKEDEAIDDLQSDINVDKNRNSNDDNFEWPQW